MTKGMIEVYTGDGKGKTTAAVGLALRARSRGLRVLFALFMKEPPGGEPEAMMDAGIDVVRFKDVRSPLFNKDVTPGQIREASLKAMEKLTELMKDKDMVVLDEFCHLLRTDILEENEVREFLASRPAGTEIVLTGRGAPSWLMELADLVTEMKEVKHPATRDIKARKGIEY